MNYILNTRKEVNKVAQAPTPTATYDVVGTELQKGIVQAVNGGGYDVAILNAAGEISGYYQRLFPWPSQATLTVGQEIWIHSDSDDAPVILLTGGGGGSCYNSTIGWGVLV